MKKILFCILILGINSALGMGSENSGDVKNENVQAVIEWSNGVLKNRSLTFYTEGPCGPAHLAVAQEHLGYLDKNIDKVKGDVQTYLKLIQFVLHTKAGQAWQEYEDKPGVTPAQELMAFGEPDANPAIRDAMQDFKKEILSRWTFCACCGPDERASLDARENALRHMLITGPEIFTDSLKRYAGSHHRRGDQFLHYANNIVRCIDSNRFRCEGVTIYQKIKDLRDKGKLDDTDYHNHLGLPCFRSKLGCHVKLEQERVPMRPVLAQALADLLPSILYPIIVDYGAGTCDLLEDDKAGVAH
jgi:hypothetical protein